MKNFAMGLIVGVGLTVLFFINFSSRYDIHMSGRLPIRTDRWTGKVELINVYQKPTKEKTPATFPEKDKMPDFISDIEMEAIEKKKFPNTARKHTDAELEAALNEAYGTSETNIKSKFNEQEKKTPNK